MARATPSRIERFSAIGSRLALEVVSIGRAVGQEASRIGCSRDGRSWYVDFGDRHVRISDHVPMPGFGRCLFAFPRRYVWIRSQMPESGLAAVWRMLSGGWCPVGVDTDQDGVLFVGSLL